MNVLVIFTYNYSLLDWKNAGNLEKELSIYKKLHKDYNHTFYFLTYGDERDLKININCPGIKIIPIYMYIKKFKNKKINFLYSFVYPFKLKYLINNIDIIKQNQLLGSWVSIILKFILKIKLFVRTGYDMYTFSKHISPKLTTKMYFILTKLTTRFADLYSVTSNADFSFIKNNFPDTKVVLRPNWVINNIYTGIESRYKNRILTVGRLEHQKNLSFLINSLNNSNYILDIVGSGSEEEKLKILAKKNNVNANFLGTIENQELQEIYKKYKFYVSSSLFEGNPKSVLEAMSHGCVVFISNIENHSELIENGKNGFLFNFDSFELQKKLNELSDNDETINIISKNAFKNVDKNNNFQSLVFKEHNDYKKLSG